MRLMKRKKNGKKKIMKKYKEELFNTILIQLNDKKYKLKEKHNDRK